jgi:hypothetical protein
VDLVAQAGGILEPEVGGRVLHLLLQGADQPLELLLGQLGEVAADLVALPRPSVLARPGRLTVLRRPEGRQDVGDGLADRLGVDVVLAVVLLLDPPPAVGLRDGPLHGVGHLVGVHDHLAVDVAGRPPHRLDQRRLTPEEALLVGVEDGDE